MTTTKWHWRNCRWSAIGIELRRWPWKTFGKYRDEDAYGGRRCVYIGPLSIYVHFSTGRQQF